MLDQLAEHEFRFSGGAILPGFEILFYDFESTLDGVAIGSVAANFEFAGQLFEETGSRDDRQAVVGGAHYSKLLPPRHAAGRAIGFPDLNACKDDS